MKALSAGHSVLETDFLSSPQDLTNTCHKGTRLSANRQRSHLPTRSSKCPSAGGRSHKEETLNYLITTLKRMCT